MLVMNENISFPGVQPQCAINIGQSQTKHSTFTCYVQCFLAFILKGGHFESNVPSFQSLAVTTRDFSMYQCTL